MAAFEPTQEVRFALVMYGGVSLAIYMNGVAQQLLHLVRSTAPDKPMSEHPTAARAKLESTEVVYRKLGQILSHGAQPGTSQPGDDDGVRTRFVIDIISGSSAGGINGVFLAKALANGQSLQELKKLWVQEGAIDKLLNDRRSTKDAGFEFRHPPDSLLSGPRLYDKLLAALADMDKESPAVSSPFVEELDLWVTTTDLRGFPLRLKVANSVVSERRYRNVFRFGYRTKEAAGEKRNSFAADWNRQLAFAGRCTSAFPFAFSPMALEDVPAATEAQAVAGGDRSRWGDLFWEYARVGDDYASRVFGDGGDLDNKPFSWAINTLATRRSTYPVHRKLAFIEPDPADPAMDPSDGTRPDPIASVVAAVNLARQQTIRDDLERVREYNRIADQVTEAMDAVELGLKSSGGRGRARQSRSVPPERPAARVKDPSRSETATWLTESGDRAQSRGAAYSVYQQLKVKQAMDDLASLVTRMVRISEESDHRGAIRVLVEAWVARRYTDPYRVDGDRGASVNQFLLDFDLQYRLRRLNFLFHRADRLARPDEASLHGVVAVKRDLSDALVVLRARWRDIQSDDALCRQATKLGLGTTQLDAILVGSTEDLLPRNDAKPNERVAAERVPPTESPGERAKVLLDDAVLCTRLDDFAGAVAAETEGAFKEVAASVEAALLAAPPQPAAEQKARKALARFHSDFDDYDMVTLPLMIGRTSEGAHVEVLRFSPGDADSLSKEGASKLAGRRYGHFGAFFDEGWRRWDIMWGRLDAAELLIKALLPANNPLREELLEEAQLQILSEELAPSPQLMSVIAGALMGGERRKEAPNKSILASLPPDRAASLAEQAVTAAVGPEEFRRQLRHLGPPGDLSPDYVLKAASRGTRITGEIFKGMSDQPALQRPGRWLAGLGRIGAGVAELALPGDFANKAIRHWTKLILLIGAFLVVAGLVFRQPGVSRLGWWTLGLTLVAMVGRTVLADVLRKKRRLPRVALWVGIVVVVALALVGGVRLVDNARDRVCRFESERWRDAFVFKCPERGDADAGDPVGAGGIHATRRPLGQNEALVIADSAQGARAG